MQSTLRNMISSITGNAQQVASAADQLLHASEQVAEQAPSKSSAPASMATSVHQMTSIIDRVKENAAKPTAFRGSRQDFPRRVPP